MTENPQKIIKSVSLWVGMGVFVLKILPSAVLHFVTYILQTVPLPKTLPTTSDSINYMQLCNLVLLKPSEHAQLQWKTVLTKTFWPFSKTPCKSKNSNWPSCMGRLLPIIPSIMDAGTLLSVHVLLDHDGLPKWFSLEP